VLHLRSRSLTLPSLNLYRIQTMLKDTILGAAVQLARKCGYQNLTRLNVAHAAECGTGTVNYHYASMDLLRTAVVEYAIQHEILPIIAEALTAHHGATQNISDALRRKTARELSGIDRL